MLRLHNLGQPHPVIEPAARWHPPGDERISDAAVWSEFERAGLLSKIDRLGDDAYDTLAALGTPSVEFFGWITQHGKSAGALIAARGEEAVRVLCRNNVVKLSSIPARGLAEELVGLMNGPPPARIEVVNIRHHALRQADGQDGDALLIAARDTQSQDLATVRMLLAQPITGLGELYAGARDHRGHYRVSRPPVGFRDTTAGRMMVWTSGAFVSLAPGSDAVLVTRLRQGYPEITE